jgi:hypothetical protein
MTINEFLDNVQRVIGKELTSFQKASIISWIPLIDRKDDDELIRVHTENGIVKIQKKHYIQQKWKALSESKYPCLTIPDVAGALENVLRGIVHETIEMEIYPDIIIKH